MRISYYDCENSNDTLCTHHILSLCSIDCTQTSTLYLSYLWHSLLAKVNYSSTILTITFLKCIYKDRGKLFSYEFCFLLYQIRFSSIDVNYFCTQRDFPVFKLNSSFKTPWCYRCITRSSVQCLVGIYSSFFGYGLFVP